MKCWESGFGQHNDHTPCSFKANVFSLATGKKSDLSFVYSCRKKPVLVCPIRNTQEIRSCKDWQRLSRDDLGPDVKVGAMSPYRVGRSFSCFESQLHKVSLFTSGALHCPYKPKCSLPGWQELPLPWDPLRPVPLHLYEYTVSISRALPFLVGGISPPHLQPYSSFGYKHLDFLW